MTTEAKPPIKKPTNYKKKNGKQFRIFEFAFSLKDLILWGFLALFVMWLFVAFMGSSTSTQNEIPLSQLFTDIKSGSISKVKVEEAKVEGEYKDETKKISFKEPQASFYQLLTDQGIDPSIVQINVVDTSTAAIWAFLGNLIPTLLFIGFFVFMIRQARGAQDSIFSFGRSGAKVFNKNLSKITFKDVAGIDEAKKEMAEVVDFLKNPKKYAELGARTPKGVLLVGPAGAGKTLLAKAVAGEANVPFFSMAGSEFMEMLVGVGAKRVRDLFAQAKKAQPSIIFIDEVDAIGRRRSTGVMGSHDEREQTLNQILVEMDGFDPRVNVLVIAATNRGDLLDPALLRPGRFDRCIVIQLPDLEGRKDILLIHSKGKPFIKNIEWEKVARRTVGFSGADLENMLNEAAIHAAGENKKEIDMLDIEEAATKVKLGPEKKRLQSEEDRKMTAYHEAGHAVITFALKHVDTVHRISIVSRGMALGYTLIPPEKDRLHETKSHLLEKISMMMGGRAAEEIVFKEITSGAANDFDQATQIARLMVIEYGMSTIGPINLGPHMDVTDLGRNWYEQPTISQSMQEKVDNEVKEILDHAYANAVSILKKNRKKLDKVAGVLLQKETIEGEEFASLMRD